MKGASVVDHSEGSCSYTDHELFLHPIEETYLQPVLFEHAMDAVECEHYYSVILANATGGAVKRPQGKQSLSCRELLTSVKIPPKSILRKCGRANNVSVVRSERHFQRCSFSGLLPYGAFEESFDARLVRSRSIQSIKELEYNVSFRHFVQVYVIPAIADIPFEVRATLWMSREEMFASIHDAATTNMEEQLGLLDQQCDELSERGCDHILQRQESDGSVTEGYLQNFAASNLEQRCVA